MLRTPSPAKQGFTLVELAIVLVVLGLIIAPLTTLLSQSAAERRNSDTSAALTAARDALLAYAVQHKGCLPHAADFEGGLPDTNAAGTAAGGVRDTGSVRAAVEPASGGVGQRAGDLPWADIGSTGLGGAGLDGDDLRLQYYVAAVYTSPTQTRLDPSLPANNNPATRDDCPARIRAKPEAWDNTARYSAGDVVLHNGALYVATGAPVAGTAPPAGAWANFAGGSIPAWSNGVAYAVGAYVNEGGVAYRALQASGGTVVTTTTNNNNVVTTTTSGTPAQAPATAPNFWRAVGVPGLGPAPEWQASGNYQRGEMVRFNGRTFRMIAAGSTNAQPVAGANGPTWRDVSTPALIGGVPKSLETRRGPNIADATDGQNASSSLHNVFVLIAPGRDANTLLNRPAVRDSVHRTCTSGSNCAVWNDLNETDVDARTFSLTPDWNETPSSPDRVLAVSFAEYQAYLERHGLMATAVQY